MGWFSDQIRQRTENDQNVLEDSFFRMASVVMDKWDANRLEDKRLISKEAIDDVLKYYHQKSIEIPDSIKEPRQLGGIRRNILGHRPFKTIGRVKPVFGPLHVPANGYSAHPAGVCQRKVQPYGIGQLQIVVDMAGVTDMANCLSVIWKLFPKEE